MAVSCPQTGVSASCAAAQARKNAVFVTAKDQCHSISKIDCLSFSRGHSLSVPQNTGSQYYVRSINSLLVGGEYGIKVFQASQDSTGLVAQPK